MPDLQMIFVRNRHDKCKLAAAIKKERDRVPAPYLYLKPRFEVERLLH
jgi:hypothetical protein